MYLSNVFVFRESYIYNFFEDPEIGIAKYQCTEVQNVSVKNTTFGGPTSPDIRCNCKHHQIHATGWQCKTSSQGLQKKVRHGYFY